MGWSHYLFLPWILGLTIQVCISPIQCNVEEIMNNGQGCHPDEFECLSGTCFPKNHHCDGHIDCYDMSDEHNCDFVLCKEPEWFKCNNGRCVKKSFTCDFDNDCEDLSDEKNCPGHEEMNNNINCSSLDFQCTSDKVCLPLNWACDGHPDCADGSDEVLGCAGKAVCNGKFMCNSTHNCIPAEFHCDGEIDCEDGSDEHDCLSEVQKKWKNIKSSYTHELKQKDESRSRFSKEAASKMKEYMFFEQLHLLKTLSKKPSSSMIGEKEEDGVLREKHSEQSSFQKQVRPTRNKEHTSNKHRKRSKNEDKVICILKNKMLLNEQTNKKDDSDEDKLFLLSLVSELHKVPPENKLNLRADIISVVTTAQMKHPTQPRWPITKFYGQPPQQPSEFYPNFQ